MTVLYDDSKNKDNIFTAQKQCFYGALNMPFKQSVLNVEVDIHRDNLPCNYYEVDRLQRIKENNIINILLMANHIQSGVSLFEDNEATQE